MIGEKQGGVVNARRSVICIVFAIARRSGIGIVIVSARRSVSADSETHRLESDERLSSGIALLVRLTGVVDVRALACGVVLFYAHEQVERQLVGSVKRKYVSVRGVCVCARCVSGVCVGCACIARCNSTYSLHNAMMRETA